MHIATTFPTMTAVPRERGWPAGDLAVWLFICAELPVFGVFFLGYAIARRYDPEHFNQGQATLDTGTGLLNTPLLVTSSYLVAKAIHALRDGRPRVAMWRLLGGYLMVVTVGIATAFLLP